jgi:hypothetical protein
MKTFSAMSTPDKRLTMEAYAELNEILKSRIENAQVEFPENIEKLRLQTHRLQQLMEVLEMDLLSD